MKRLLVALAASTLVVGCASVQNSYSGSVYQGNQAQRAQQVAIAQIVSIREVTIQDKPGVAGATVGAGIGALAVLGLAGTNGNPYGLAIGAIAAAFGGGMASDYVANKIMQQPGFEFTLKMRDGRMFTVVQSNIDSMAIGDVVNLTKSSDGTLRVYKM